MIKAEIKSRIVFPKEFITQDDLMHIGDKIFVPLLGKGIDSGIGVDGAPFPEPESEKTAQRWTQKKVFTKKGDIRATAISKISRSGLMGFGKKILIDTGKLRRSFFAEKVGDKVVNVSIQADRKDIGKHLQVDGIKTKRGKKFYNFFGITDGMERNAMEYANRKVKEVCRKFNGKE